MERTARVRACIVGPTMVKSPLKEADRKGIAFDGFAVLPRAFEL